MIVLHKKIWFALTFLLFAMISFVLMLWQLRAVASYLIGAICIIYIISLCIRRLEGLGLANAHASLVVGGVFILCIVLILVFVAPTIASELVQLPSHWELFQERLGEDIIIVQDGGYYSPLIGRSIPLDDVRSLQSVLFTQMNAALRVFGRVLFGLLFIVPFITYTLIRQGTELKRKFIAWLPNKYFEVLLSMFYEINTALENFIGAKIIQSIIVAVICTVGFAFVGVPVPLLMGFLAGVFNVIPFVGPILAGVFPVVSSFVVLGGKGALYATLVLVFAQIIDNGVTQPILLPKLLSEHPALVLLITLLGAELFGPIGLVFALPVFSVMKIVLTQSYVALVAHYGSE